jgi:hypothetical protein
MWIVCKAVMFIMWKYASERKKLKDILHSILGQNHHIFQNSLYNSVVIILEKLQHNGRSVEQQDLCEWCAQSTSQTGEDRKER